MGGGDVSTAASTNKGGNSVDKDAVPGMAPQPPTDTTGGANTVAVVAGASAASAATTTPVASSAASGAGLGGPSSEQKVADPTTPPVTPFSASSLNSAARVAGRNTPVAAMATQPGEHEDADTMGDEPDEDLPGGGVPGIGGNPGRAYTYGYEPSGKEVDASVLGNTVC